MASVSNSKYTSSTIWLLIEKILRIISAIFIGAMVARYLGPEKYGVFNYSLSLVTIFSALSLLGLNNIVVKELVSDNGISDDEILSTSMILRVVGALAMMAFLSIFLLINKDDQQIRIYTFCISFFMGIVNIFKILELYFQAKVASKYIAISNIFALVSIIIIKIYLVTNSYSLNFFIATIAIEFIVISLLLYLFYYIKFGNITVKFDISLAKNMFKQAWPFILTGIIANLYMRIDQVMVKNMIGAAAVGQYSVAVRLGEAWYFVPMIIVNSLFPAIISAKNMSQEKYITIVSKLYRSLILLAVVAGVGVLFFGNFVILKLFGDAYKEAVMILSVHIWAGVFVSIGVVTSKCIVTDDLTRYLLPVSLVSVIINIILNYLLIPGFGGIGAAVATLFTQMFGGYVILLFIKDFSHYRKAVHSIFKVSPNRKKL